MTTTDAASVRFERDGMVNCGRWRAGARTMAAMAFALLAAFAPAGCKDKEAERVDKTLVTLSNANAARDADKIVSLLTPRTVDTYSEYVQLARTGTKDQIVRAGPGSAALVLGLRLQYSEPQLKRMTGEALIRQLVNDGRWTFLFDDKESFELGPAIVTGDSARLALSQRVEQPRFRGRRAGTASLLFGKKKGVTYQVYLVKDDDNTWRLDETSMIEMENRIIEDYLGEIRMSTDAFLKKALESDDTTPPPAEMWNPLKSGAAALRPQR